MDLRHLKTLAWMINGMDSATLKSRTGAHTNQSYNEGKFLERLSITVTQLSQNRNQHSVFLHSQFHL